MTPTLSPPLYFISQFISKSAEHKYPENFISSQTKNELFLRSSFISQHRVYASTVITS